MIVMIVEMSIYCYCYYNC